MTATQECEYQLIKHPAYSAQLTPTDYFFAGDLKQRLRETKYRDGNKLQSPEKSILTEGIKLLFEWLKECIEVQMLYLSVKKFCSNFGSMRIASLFMHPVIFLTSNWTEIKSINKSTKSIMH